MKSSSEKLHRIPNCLIEKARGFRHFSITRSLTRKEDVMISRKSNQTGSINTTERWISGIAGGALAFYAVKNLKNRRRRSWAGYSSAVGASLMLFRSVTGKSPLYRLIGINTQNRDLP